MTSKAVNQHWMHPSRQDSTAPTSLAQGAWVHGLKLAAVPVVAQAVWTMGRRLCPDRTRMLLGLAAAALLLLGSSNLTQLGVICLEGLAGWLLCRLPETDSPTGKTGPGAGHGGALAALMGFAALLLLLPAAAGLLGWPWLRWFDAFYRSGSLVFGGGHVVLPLLRSELVPTGWLSDDGFLAGYGAAQALPGPLFAVAGYLGTMLQGGRHAWVGGSICLVAVFLPAYLLVGGSLPFWQLLRRKAWMQAALRGVNAAVVGILLAAFLRPICTEGLVCTRDLFMAFACLFALMRFRAPSWLIVLACAAYAQWPLP